MRAKRGFALIAALWTVAALAGVVGLAVGAARVGQQASVNRLALTRGRWAAEACLAVAQARWAQHRLADADSIDLGRQARCRWEVRDPTARLNVNVADPEVLAVALGAERDSGRVLDSVLRLRAAGPITDLAQVASVPGVDSAALSLLTVDGPGQVNANAAGPRVLGALPGLMPEAVARLRERRRLGRPITSLDALAADVSPAARAQLLAHYADLARELVFTPPVLLVTAGGWVGGVGGRDRLHTAIEVLAVPLPGRLAVVRRRMW
jgi:hypothetical protein